MTLFEISEAFLRSLDEPQIDEPASDQEIRKQRLEGAVERVRAGDLEVPTPEKLAELRTRRARDSDHSPLSEQEEAELRERLDWQMFVFELGMKGGQRKGLPAVVVSINSLQEFLDDVRTLRSLLDWEIEEKMNFRDRAYQAENHAKELQEDASEFAATLQTVRDQIRAGHAKDWAIDTIREALGERD